jgi:hypothetical protein
MRLALGRAAWALTAAGSLGLTLTALAQQPPQKLPLEVAKQTAERIEPKASAALSPARLAEINVELAWLADTETFRCQLAARKVGDKLEVGGFVPHAGLKARALEIATKHSTLPVADKLVVLPNSELKIASSTQDALCESAASLLGKIMSKFGAEFEFGTDGHGQITISGNVPSPEDKLTISRRLSQLSGCTAVLNNMNVVADMPLPKPALASKPIVQPDGSLVVEQHVSPPVVTSINGKALPDVKVPGIPTQTVSAKATPNRGIGGLAGRFMNRKNDNSNSSVGTLIAQQAVQSPNAPTIVNQTVVATSAMPPQAAAAVQQVAYEAPAKHPTNMVQAAAYQAPAKQPTNVVQAAAYQVPAQQPTNVVKPASYQVPVQKTTNPVKPVSHQAPVQQTAARPQTPAKPVSPYGGKALANASNRPQPSSAYRSASAQVAQAPAVQVPAQPAPGTMSAAEQLNVMKKISSVCGNAASDVQVKCLGNGDCVIMLRVASKQQGQELGPKILNLPELNDYKVKLQMQVLQQPK